jgi:hypothetical protein
MGMPTRATERSNPDRGEKRILPVFGRARARPFAVTTAHTVVIALGMKKAAVTRKSGVVST